MRTSVAWRPSSAPVCAGAPVCGAATGGLMALGLLGADEETAVEFQRRFPGTGGGHGLP